ncbi:histone H3.v1-like [Bombina bombina]|uniref:histone H3.v1-like n=1 Tax=Bombina bombina TaxID=8345 RepID=UPI00235AC74F|nr:histone H3.v1-like [Bombina bombina]
MDEDRTQDTDNSTPNNNAMDEQGEEDIDNIEGHVEPTESEEHLEQDEEHLEQEDEEGHEEDEVHQGTSETQQNLINLEVHDEDSQSPQYYNWGASGYILPETFQSNSAHDR